MSSRSVSSFASARCLFHLLQTTPPTIGNIVGGVFWRPIFNILEGHLEVMVVNAQHIKAVPGRKTDIKDAEWIADLLQHGLLRPSFIPPAWQRIVRELTRSRTSLSEERSRVIARLHNPRIAQRGC